MINCIWAMDKNWLIGKDNKIPWHYKEDLLYYKQKTNNEVVLMGLKTYLSLKTYYKTKPLPYSLIYVCNPDFIPLDDALVVNDAKKFLETYDGKDDLWVVGGASIYNLAIPFADRLYITHIDKEYEGDAYLKKFNLEEDFKKISSTKNGDLEFAVYERK